MTDHSHVGSSRDDLLEEDQKSKTELSDSRSFLNPTS